MKGWGRWLLAAGALALLCGNSGARRLLRNALQLRRSDKKLTSLKQEENALRKGLNDLKTDDRRLETVARRELGLLKAGEIEYRFDTGVRGEGSGVGNGKD